MTVSGSSLYFHQQTPWNFVNCRKYSELSPIYPRTSPIVECPIAKNLIGEVRVTQKIVYTVVAIYTQYIYIYMNTGENKYQVGLRERIDVEKSSLD